MRQGRAGAAALPRLVLVLAALCGAPAATAGDVGEAKLMLRGDGGKAPDAAGALRRFERAARAGDAAGAYYLALMYKNGNAVPRDSAAAARWLVVAADGGIAPAMFVLANMLLAGDGVKRDLVAARRWLDRADQLGYAEAALAKAIGLRDGSMGYPRDEAAAQLQMHLALDAMAHRAPEP